MIIFRTVTQTTASANRRQSRFADLLLTVTNLNGGMEPFKMVRLKRGKTRKRHSAADATTKRLEALTQGGRGSRRRSVNSRNSHLALIHNTILQLRARITKIWTAVTACRGEAQRRLERSGDTAFRTTGCFQKRRGASLPAAVQIPWLRRKPRWVYPRIAARPPRGFTPYSYL